MDQKSKLQTLSLSLSQTLRSKHFKLTTAESCTGGWIAQAITEVPGSSAWFDRGFITYSNEAKEEMLGVKSATLMTHGAVSQQTAIEMAQGALLNSQADISISVTGIAGPGGGTDEKPIGTVWIGCASKDNTTADCYQFEGDRHAVREQAVIKALEIAIKLIQ